MQIKVTRLERVKHKRLWDLGALRPYSFTVDFATTQTSEAINAFWRIWGDDRSGVTLKIL